MPRPSCVCANAGTVRLNFVRNDVFSFTSDNTDNTDIYHSLRALILMPFTVRATEADLVVLGIGQHFPLMAAALLARASPMPLAALDAATLEISHAFVNHSLASLTRARASIGKPAGSVVLVGSSVAVPNCSLHDVPADGEDAGAVGYAADPQEDAGRYRYLHSWRLNAQLNSISAHVASELGMPYLSLSRPSLQRADAAHGNETEGIEDCVHYCTPGPVDAWATLLYNLLQWREPVWQRRAAAGAQVFGKIDARSWVANKSVAARLELPCRPGGSLAGSDLRCGQALHDLDWWPYACGRPQGGSKAAVNSCVDAMLPRFAASARSAMATTMDAVLRTAVTHDPGCIKRE